MGVATALAVGSLAVGAASAASASSNAKKARHQAGDAAEAQEQSAQDQLDFGKQQYGDWKDMFYPAMGDLRTQAYQTQTPDYAALAENVGNSFDTSQAINQRNMERFGVNPTDGAFQASNTQYGLGRALATTGAFNQARQDARDQQFNRLASFVQLGQGQQSTASGAVANGFGALQGAFGNQQGAANASASDYAAAAAQGARMAGRGASSLMNQFATPATPAAGMGSVAMTGNGVYTGPGAVATPMTGYGF